MAYRRIETGLRRYLSQIVQRILDLVLSEQILAAPLSVVKTDIRRSE